MCKGYEEDLRARGIEQMKVSWFKVYMRYFIIHFKSAMQYKKSFFMSMLGQFLVAFGVFLGMFFMFQRFHSIRGFTYEEVLLCFGIVLMAFSLAEGIARGFDTFSGLVKRGTFDRIMVRPRNEILQVLGSKIEFSKLGRVLQALMILIYAILESNIKWTFAKAIVLMLMLIGGMVIFTGLFLLYASICFFTLEGLEFFNIFTDGAREFGQYPFDIYGKRILQLCTFGIPYALVQYYPLLYLLDRGKWWYGLLPLVACLFMVPCYIAWKIGVRHYQSSGS